MRHQYGPFQSSVAGFFEDFLRYHRALGKQFDTEEHALRMFDRYLFEHKIQRLADITPTLFQVFLNSRSRPIPKSYNHLLGVLRRWCDWLVGQEQLADSPLQLRPRRLTATRTPFLFNPVQARQLLAAAAELPDNNRAQQRGLIYYTILTLLYGLGLRVGEVTRLRFQEVDWDRCILTIRNTKFAKSRLVPFGSKLAAKLQGYRRQRELMWGTFAESDPLFSFDPKKNKNIHPGTISQTFLRLWPRLNITLPDGVAPPRLHCLRQSFAVATLLGWYRAGINPNEAWYNCLPSWGTPIHPLRPFILPSRPICFRKPSGTTTFEPAISDWLRCGPSSTTWCSVCQRLLKKPNELQPFQPKEWLRRKHDFWIEMRLKYCSVPYPHLLLLVCVIEHSFCSSTTPGPEFRKSLNLA